MTKKEAYNRIDAIVAKYEIDNEYVTIKDPKDFDALRVAVKTLERNEGLENMVKMGIAKDCESCKVEVLEKLEAEIDEAYEDLDGYDPDSLGTLACRIGEIIDKYKRE